MPLVDLSGVTDALRTAIREGVSASSAWTPNPAPNVEAVPPEHMASEGLTMYLFAVGENATAANRPGHTADLPLGLDLHYQLVAHGAAIPPTTLSLQREQLLLGLAMKVLHDVPRLEAGVTVNGVDIFGVSGIPAGNTMSITLRKIDPDQAITWWTASESGIRAAAYYTVSVALIQEQPEPVSGPPVLVREVFGFAGMAPHVLSTAATHTIARPGDTPTPVSTSPAQVTPGQTFTIEGVGLGGRVRVQVRGENWPAAGTLAGSSFQGVGGVETVVTSLDPRVDGRLVVPGLLRVRVVREEDRLLRDGSTRTFTSESNETAISVVPIVAAVAPPGGAGAPFVLSGEPFEAPDVDPSSVRLLVGADELARVPAGPGVGQFSVVDRTTIEFVPATTSVTGDLVRLRLLVNGAESLPFWYVAP